MPSSTPARPQRLPVTGRFGLACGIITLTGHVRTWAEHDAVVGAAMMAIGVIGGTLELAVPSTAVAGDLAFGRLTCLLRCPLEARSGLRRGSE
jgi:hypothetical protein